MNTLQKSVKTATKSVPAVGQLAEAATNLVGLSRYQNTPLHLQLENVPAPIGATSEGVKVSISTLSNGIRVVSRETNEPLSNVGLYVDVGSRYLAPHSSAACHYMSDMQMTWMPTKTRSLLQASTDFFRMGGGLQITPFRDCMLYRAECFRADTQPIMDILADLALNSEFEDWIVGDRHDEYLWRRGDQLQNTEELIPELMHQAAYNGNTYGLNMYADDMSIKEMNGELMRYVQGTFFQPSRIIAVGTGVNHEMLEDIAFNSLGHLREGEGSQSASVTKAAPQYTGGDLRLRRNLDDGQVHLGLAFETENWHSKDLMAMCVLNMMMGGGGSFSAGGPGKGMYTRLYQEALARYSWINHISCSHSIYEDTALFCYYATSLPEHAGRLVGVMVEQAKAAADKAPSAQELERAKTALANNICYEYERREVQFEDIARQTAVYGKHRSPHDWQEEIKAVSADDVQRVAQRMIKKPPTLAACGGELAYVPVYSDLVNKFN